MKVFLLIFLLHCCSIAFSNETALIDNAINMYQQNGNSPLPALQDVYQKTPSSLQIIKFKLYNRQYHSIYRELLDTLPQTGPVLKDWMEVSFLINNWSGFSSHLSNYLIFYPLQSLVVSYSQSIVSQEFLSSVTSDLTLPTVLELIIKSAFTVKSFQPVDQVLINLKEKSWLSNEQVQAYVKQSWPLEKRNIAPLLRAYPEIQSPESDLFLLVSLYQENNWLALTNKSEDRYDTQLAKFYKADPPYYFAEAFLNLGLVKEALAFAEQSLFPDIYPTAELKFRCQLWNGQYDSARTTANSVRNRDHRDFFQAFSLLCSTETAQVSNGLRLMEQYAAGEPGVRSFLPEALLINYTALKESKKLALVQDTVIWGITGKPAPDLSETLYSRAYKELLSDDGSTGKPDTSPSPLNDFITYQSALRSLSTGNTNQAQSSLLALIKKNNASPFVRSLAVYVVRRLPE